MQINFVNFISKKIFLAAHKNFFFLFYEWKVKGEKEIDKAKKILRDGKISDAY